MSGSDTSAIGQAERRQLTLLFCDLVNYSAISSRLDPEDLRDLVDAYRASCERTCAAYGGSAPHYSGDGVFVVFGHPEAHEDDAERAVRAGLELVQATAGLGGTLTRSRQGALAVRVGIATGLVVVDPATSVVGESANLAARLQAVAEPNAVVIADSTHRLIGGLFECQSLGHLVLKGFPSPMKAWRVRGSRGVATRFDAVHASDYTPLVGRTRELNRLLRAWTRAASGQGHAIRIHGEAGIGKSRLVHELMDRLDPSASTTVLYQGVAHHRHSAFYPIVAQLERAAGLVSDEQPDQKLDKLEKLLVGSTADVRREMPLFASLLSIPTSERYPPLRMSPLERKQRTLHALCDQLARLTDDRPVLVAVEDAHWLDPTSRELLHFVIARASSLRVLVVITERSSANTADDGRWPAASLEVLGLDRRQSTAMVGRLTKGRKLPDVVLEHIVSRTDGVPLFIEELTQTILTSDMNKEEQGDYTLMTSRGERAIPVTLQDSLMARLDQLGSARDLAQLAAIIGREFTGELLASAAGVPLAQLAAPLDRLTGSGLVLRRRSRYLFKHALVQDAAYQSLLRSRRREIHERLAITLEREAPRQADVEPELLAYHYTAAGLDQRALDFWIRAGQRALARSANIEASEHFTRALVIVGRMPDGEGRWRLELECQIGLGAARRAVEGFASPGVEQSFTRARELCKQCPGSTAQLMDTLRGLFACYYTRSDFRRAREQGERVFEDAADHPSYLMMGHWMLGCVMFWQGEFPEARRRLEMALALYDPAKQRSETLDMQIDLEANATLHLGWTLWFLGYADQANAKADEAIGLARRLGQPFALAMALFWASATRVCCGAHTDAEVFCKELRALTTRYHIAYLGAAGTVLEAHSTLARGKLHAGVAHMRRALEEFRRQRAGLGWTFAISLPAAACAHIGEAEEGLALVAEAFEVAEKHGDRFWEAELHRLKGDLLLVRSARNDNEAAEQCYRRAAEIAARQGAKFLELRAATSLTRLNQRRGNGGATLDWLEQLYASFEEGHQTNDLQEARSILNCKAKTS